ncbi:MAG: DUF5103 domain-containing protein [Muribaculaceae bacterium]|nr:DUF5103 domain-containing protein [Muribaculaceae bacterium]
MSSFYLHAATPLDTRQQILKPNVRTLTVSNPDNFMAPPIIRLGTNDKLDINFDIIGDEHDYLRYRLIHCNSDWQPSRFLESETIDGFNEISIEDFAYSSNTYIHYVNYNIRIPNNDFRILRSGNYLLEVFPENEPGEILLKARFSVSEEASGINGIVTSRTDKGVNSEFQQLVLDVDLGNLGDINPYQDLIVIITQNNDPSTTRFVSHPMRVDRGKAIFEHTPQLIFDGGNEFRRFETVRTDYPGMHVDSVKFKDGLWHAWLQPDFSRKDKEYVYDSTQLGRFKIDEYNSTDPDLSADYVMVHFSLDPGERQFGEIYIDGDLTNHIFNDQNLMRYDWNSGLYQASIPLKQGSYNYKYTILSEKGIPSSFPIEGNKYETKNEYLVNVFLRQPGARGDRLIASKVILN